MRFWALQATCDAILNAEEMNARKHFYKCRALIEYGVSSKELKAVEEKMSVMLKGVEG